METKSKSLSFHTSGKMTSIKHNNRDKNSKGKLKDYGTHINWDKTEDNLILVKKDIKDVYKKEFSQAVKEYNAVQKRKDRKIDEKHDGYYKKVKHDKAMEGQREFIVQMGQKDDEDKFPEDTYNEIFKDFLNRFQEENPNFKIYNAVVHHDEGTPHMHMNVVPVGTGYKRGISKRPSFNKALKNENLNFDDFMHRNIDNLSSIMYKTTGYKRRIINDNHKYLKPQQYRELMAKANKKMQQANNMYNQKINELKQREQELNQREKELNQHEQELNQREKELNQHEQELKQ